MSVISYQFYKLIHGSKEQYRMWLQRGTCQGPGALKPGPANPPGQGQGEDQGPCLRPRCFSFLLNSGEKNTFGLNKMFEHINNNILVFISTQLEKCIFWCYFYGGRVPRRWKCLGPVKTIMMLFPSEALRMLFYVVPPQCLYWYLGSNPGDLGSLL